MTVTASITPRFLPYSLLVESVLTCSAYLSTCSHSSKNIMYPWTTQNRLYHVTPALFRPGYRPERNPKIKITLQQLRMAARTQGRRLPICHEQQEKVMNALEAAKYENHAIYKYVKEYEKCREDYEANHKGKDKALMKELNKYLVRDRKK